MEPVSKAQVLAEALAAAVGACILIAALAGAL